MKIQNFKTVQRMLKDDNDLIWKATSNFTDYCSELEELCKKDVDQDSVISLVDIGQSLYNCFDVPDKYDGFWNLNEISDGTVERLQRIRHLEAALDNTIEYGTNNLVKQWNSAKKSVEKWAPRFGINDLEKSRAELHHVTDMYTELAEGLVDLFSQNRVKSMEKYAQFIDDVAELDKELTLFKADYPNPDGLTAEEVNVLLRDFNVVYDKYVNVVKRNVPRLKKVFRRGSIFEFRERFIELDEIRNELIAYSENNQGIRDAKQIVGMWMIAYQNNLDYLSKNNAVNVEHVSEVTSFEIAEKDFITKWEKNKYLQEDVRELLGLEEVMHRGVERELHKIKDDLGERVADVESKYKIQVPREEMETKIAELQQYLPGLNDVILMLKLIEEPTKEVSELRDNLDTRIEFYQNQLEFSVEPQTIEVEPQPRVSSGKIANVRNQNNYYDLPTHLNVIGFPPMKYMRMMEAILDGDFDWQDRLREVREEIRTTSLPTNLKEYDYARQFEYAVREDMNRGNMDHLVSRTAEGYTAARETLGLLQDYIRRSEEHLELNAAEIQAHQPLYGPENSYNASLIIQH